MSNIFVRLYDWFAQRRRLLYGLLALLVVALGAMAVQVRFDENINSFFSDGDNKEQSAMFENLKIKDKIAVMISGEDPDAIVEAAEIFKEQLQPLLDEGVLLGITDGTEAETMERSTDFIYNYLPIFFDESDYQRLDSLLTREGVQLAVDNTYNMLTSATGMAVGDVLTRDPLGVGTHLLRRFERFSTDFEYELYGGHLFTADLRTMLLFIDPALSMGRTGDNDSMVTLLDAAAAEAEQVEGVQIEQVGGPIVAVHNARRIKKDTALTMSLALIVIITVVYLSFRQKWAIPLISMPPAFGALFALAVVWLVQGAVSAIAIGAGVVVLGIALSYSIHVISHSNHIHSPRQIVRELSYPLTLGCMTTIGAFVALMFTSSSLLQDMGLFSAAALVGTTLFCLVFLPHFLGGMTEGGESRLLERIERWNGYAYESKRWVILAIVAVVGVCLCFYQDVRFDEDMTRLNYMPDNIARAEQRLTTLTGSENDVYIVTSSHDLSAASQSYAVLESLCQGYRGEGKVEDFTSVSNFVVEESVQRERIARWEAFWAERRASVVEMLHTAARKKGFRDGAFARFDEMVEREYEPCRYDAASLVDVPVLSEWITHSGGVPALISRVKIEPQHKDEVYAAIDKIGRTTVIDRAYFSSKMVAAASDDFNFILLISSAIVFVALFLSYGRIELAALTFLPMCISWVIILGLMAMFDLRFNIVNIILATFIFGIGDDFSIFIMDGLLQEYKTGEKVLRVHKTAIFFSAFTTIVGMGVLILASHPALKSIALISVMGMCVVVFVSYTLQPFLFRLLISEPAKRGYFPYTLPSILNMIYEFGFFLAGCVVAQLLMVVLTLLPIGRRRRKAVFHSFVHHFARLILGTMITTRVRRDNPHGEDYSRPSVIVANHQSFIDILLMLSLTPRVVMVTNSWVWHSPFFGWIVQYADFYHAANGYEALADSLRDRVAEGYSVVVFPEGTRSPDCRIQRFHKGAFYLAQLLKLDLLPVVIFGAGQVSAKRQGFYVKHGRVVARTMPRIAYGSDEMGATYQEQSKRMRRYFERELARLTEEYGRTDSPYLKDALQTNYIYKGPVLEWYMRIKMRRDGYYAFWDDRLPLDATITDVGCGYGQLSFMLAMRSASRHITAIDYDEDKIALARHSFLARCCNVEFRADDMRRCDLPQSDAFLFNDSLHYVSERTQAEVLHRCVERLNQGGQIIVRDGDASKRENMDSILRAEWWSTRVLRFNRSDEPLRFVNAEWMERFARQHNLQLSLDRCDEQAMETIYIFTKR